MCKAGQQGKLLIALLPPSHILLEVYLQPAEQTAPFVCNALQLDRECTEQHVLCRVWKPDTVLVCEAFLVLQEPPAEATGKQGGLWLLRN